MRALISMRTRKRTRNNRRAMWLTAPFALGVVVISAHADSLQIVGYSGHLGEWELTATVTEEGSSAERRYSGALLMKHVGLCTQEGPEEKSGNISIRMPSSSSQLEATLRVDGVECSYRGIRADFYSGTMNCTGREAVPLKLWVQ
ncbi:MAG TPA: hypothetical protein VJV58_05515 [Bradyrhizobium sp.]|nr:hypothetical protein [Bradyrhizobium sp.]